MKTYTKEEVLEIIGQDEEQHPSGYQRNEIKIRNQLRAEQRKNLQKVVE